MAIPTVHEHLGKTRLIKIGIKDIGWYVTIAVRKYNPESVTTIYLFYSFSFISIYNYSLM